MQDHGKHSGRRHRSYWQQHRRGLDMDVIAATYGYPNDKWNVSQITGMSDLFEGKNEFNEYIGSWDVTSVTDMGHIFYGATAFNQDIGSWDVSSVTNMHAMFHDAAAFNQDI
jgi:surface protein